ncbi:MAG: bifunctional D-glycero-beta-D-manno-heptose-7-phosphate kinase/D-glycero-beta-D-manno-heptose 1-phosphate adenylyltransferase HldE [Pseudomonadota bacterium]
MILPAFAKARVLVAGDVMLDRYWSGSTSRISPEAPVPVVKIAQDVVRAGGAANVALNLAALGVTTTALGVVGDDADGALLAEALRSAAITPQLLQGRAPTIAKLRVMSRNQQLLRMDFEQRLDVAGAFDRAALIARFEQALEGSDAVILSDYGKGTLADVAALITAAREEGKPVLIDPKGTDWSAYAGATLLTPNLSEFEAVVGKCGSDAELIAKAEALRAKLNLTALLVTRSERGMTLIEPGRAPLHLPTAAREVFDVTGAGDTVIATLGAALAAGSSLADACRLANAAAGITVGKLGAATVSPAELMAALGHITDGSVLDEDTLVTHIESLKQLGKTVVMTNGCFDILHTGHVRYLEAARALGDVLIVAVNTDDSVKRLKGPTRPLNNCVDRMAVLAALRCVDFCVPFSEDTPARLIGRVLPQLLVKGGDYKPQDIAGYDDVTAAGGQVMALDFHDGYSTTKLIARAQQP